VVEISIGQHGPGDGRLAGFIWLSFVLVTLARVKFGSGFDLGAQVGRGSKQEPGARVGADGNLSLGAGFSVEGSGTQGAAVGADAIPLGESSTGSRAKNLDAHVREFSSRAADQLLALADGGSATERVKVPELDVGGEVLDPDLALHLGSGLTQPDDAELSFRIPVLEIDDVARSQLRAYALQRGSAAADGAQAGGLGEGAGIGVHTPDLHGKLDEHTRLAAAVHE